MTHEPQVGDGGPPTRESSQEGDDGPSMMAAVARAMTALYKEHFGRGPVTARAHWAGSDMLVCALEQSLTRAEQNLRDMGQHERLRDIRIFFQYATVPEFVGAVEQITGRTVRSFISGIDTVEDISLETFVLYPVGQEGRSRGQRGDGVRA